MDVWVIVVLRGLKLEERRKEKGEAMLLSCKYFFFHLIEWSYYDLTVALQWKILVSEDVGSSLECPVRCEIILCP